MEELNAPNFITKLPDLIRWIIFLPSALIAMMIVSGLNKLITSNYLGIDPESFWINAYISYLSSAIFIYVGAVGAPKKQFIVSIVLSMLFSVIIGISIVSNFTTHTNSMLEQLIYSILSLAGVGSVLYAIHKELVGKEN